MKKKGGGRIQARKRDGHFQSIPVQVVSIQRRKGKEKKKRGGGGPALSLCTGKKKKNIALCEWKCPPSRSDGREKKRKSNPRGKKRGRKPGDVVAEKIRTRKEGKGEEEGNRLKRGGAGCRLRQVKESALPGRGWEKERRQLNGQRGRPREKKRKKRERLPPTATEVVGRKKGKGGKGGSFGSVLQKVMLPALKKRSLSDLHEGKGGTRG